MQGNNKEERGKKVKSMRGKGLNKVVGGGGSRLHAAVRILFLQLCLHGLQEGGTPPLALGSTPPSQAAPPTQPPLGGGNPPPPALATPWAVVTP